MRFTSNTLPAPPFYHKMWRGKKCGFYKAVYGTRTPDIETILFTRNYRTEFFHCRRSVKIADIFPKKELLKYCTLCKHSKLFG